MNDHPPTRARIGWGWTETGIYWKLIGFNGQITATSHPQTFEFPTDARRAAANAIRMVGGDLNLVDWDEVPPHPDEQEPDR